MKWLKIWADKCSIRFDLIKLAKRVYPGEGINSINSPLLVIKLNQICKYYEFYWLLWFYSLDLPDEDRGTVYTFPLKAYKSCKSLIQKLLGECFRWHADNFNPSFNIKLNQNIIIADNQIHLSPKLLNTNCYCWMFYFFMIS